MLTKVVGLLAVAALAITVGAVAGGAIGQETHSPLIGGVVSFAVSYGITTILLSVL